MGASELVYTYDAPSGFLRDRQYRHWRSKSDNVYELDFCEFCEVDAIRCPVCGLWSCSGGGCDKCYDDFEEFINGRPPTAST